MRKIAATVCFVLLLGWLCLRLLEEDAVERLPEGASSPAWTEQDEERDTAAHRRSPPPPATPSLDVPTNAASRRLRVLAEDDTELTQASVRFTEADALYFAGDMVPDELLRDGGFAGGENVVVGRVRVGQDGTVRLRGRIAGRVLVDGSPLREMTRIGMLVSRPDPRESRYVPTTYCEVYTQADGTFRIDNVAPRLRGTLRCDVDFRRADNGPSLDFDGPAEDVVIELTRRPRVTAVLHDAKDYALAHADVEVNHRHNVHRTDITGLLQFTVPRSGHVRMKLDDKVLWRSEGKVEHDLNLGVLRVVGHRNVRAYVYDSDGVFLESGMLRSGSKLYLRDDHEQFISARVPSDAADFVISAAGHRSARVALDDREEYHVRLSRSVEYTVETWTRRGLTGNLPLIVRSEKPLPPRLNCIAYLDEKTALFRAQWGRVRISGLTSDDEIEAFPVCDAELLIPVAEPRILRRPSDRGVERFDVDTPGLHSTQVITITLVGRDEQSPSLRLAVGGSYGFLEPRPVVEDELSWTVSGVVRELAVRVEQLGEDGWETVREGRHVPRDGRIEIRLD